MKRKIISAQAVGVIPTIHPGKILAELLDERGLAQAEFARHLNETKTKINEIIRGKRGISAEAALKFSRAFGTTPDLWLNLQKNWELAQVRPAKYQSVKPLEETKLARTSSS